MGGAASSTAACWSSARARPSGEVIALPPSAITIRMPSNVGVRRLLRHGQIKTTADGRVGKMCQPAYRGPVSRLLVVGDGPVAEALVPQAELLGWSPTVVSDLAAAKEALPDVDAVVVTSDHDDVDGPALAAALSRAPAYIGAMGSRRTQERRRAWLLDHGLSPDDLEPIHGPAGLDIGADAPPEIALAIMAELVATVRGAAVAGSLRDRTGPIHPDLPPGTA